MKISLYQFDPIWEDKKSNQQKISKQLDISKIDSDVVIFPEMTLTGFTMNSKKFSEKIDGETTLFYQSIAEEKNIHIFAGFIEQENGKYFNSLIHINRNGDLKAKYQKIHPFSFSGENRHYESGEKPVITKVDQYKIGLSICYDLRFPELFRIYGKERVDAIINIANWPIQRIEHWQHLLKSRAIENLCFVIGVNRVGKDKGNKYNGQSAIHNPLGESALYVGNKETIKSFNIDFEKVKEARNQFPFLDDIKLI
jgi:omega-amidase